MHIIFFPIFLNYQKQQGWQKVQGGEGGQEAKAEGVEGRDEKQ